MDARDLLEQYKDELALAADSQLLDDLINANETAGRILEELLDGRTAGED